MLEIPRTLVTKLNQFQLVEPKTINKYYLKKIKQAVRKKEKRAKFYKVKDTSIVGGVEERDFIETLNDIQTRFIEVELYELARECENLIQEIYIEKLIKETQQNG
jgi:hypothetical protein